MTTPPETGSLIMQLHSLPPVSHQNQRHLWMAVWTKAVRQQTASHCMYLKSVIFSIITIILIVFKLPFSENCFKGGVGSSCPSTEGGFESLCPEGRHTPHCPPKLQRPERVCGPPCQHSERAYERKRLR